MGERRCCRKSLHGCGAFALSVSEAAALTRLAGAVVGGKMNTIAADDFQHSSHFTVAGVVRVRLVVDGIPQATQLFQG